MVYLSVGTFPGPWEGKSTDVIGGKKVKRKREYGEFERKRVK
jgi:hypothetical protein